MSSHNLLEQADEDALHAARLLNVEEKLIKRVTKRLLAPGSLIPSPQDTLPTPPPDASAKDDEEIAQEKQSERERRAEQDRKWREDVLIDFEAFDSNVVRAQLLLNSNERERVRYAEEKERILETAQAVRETNASLREQLSAAQRTLEVRKGYDELAEKITNNRMLKPREEQHAQLEKLNAEIAELERESEEYAATWAERREQFGRIVEEGMQMLRLIRDEKEEAERKEGMEEIDVTEDISRDGNSRPGTPAGSATPSHIPDGAEKPSPSQGSKLKGEVEFDSGSTQQSRAATPAFAELQVPGGEGEDSQMSNSAAETPTQAVKPMEASESQAEGNDAQMSGDAHTPLATPAVEIETETMDTT